MCTIMTRGGAEFWWGKELPKEVAYLIKEIGEDWKEVTYKEIFARKKARQDSNIYRKRAHEEVRPCAIWVFWNEPLWHMFFGGWWIYVRLAVSIISSGRIRFPPRLRRPESTCSNKPSP